MYYFLYLLSIFLIFPTMVLSETVNLDFNSLPSTQGWKYIADDNSIAETNIFSVTNEILYQNSLDTTGSNIYFMYDTIDYKFPLTIMLTARVLQVDNSSHPFGFSFGLSFINTVDNVIKKITIGIDTNKIQDSSGNIISSSIDNTKFNNYRLVLNTNSTFHFYVNESMLYTGTAIDVLIENNDSNQNYIFLGDGTYKCNALAEIKEYIFIQTDERKGLIDFYNSTDGKNWNNNMNWLGEIGTECNWYGVICDDHNSVKAIHLFNNNLNGTIPHSISNLAHLKSLLLHGNNLTGNIPEEILQIKTLESITLYDNYLSNNIISLMNQKIQDERKKWDANNDNEVGIEDAIYALKISSGMFSGENSTYTSCQEIVNSGFSKGDGNYIIDSDGTGENPSFEVYCYEMDSVPKEYLNLVHTDDQSNFSYHGGYNDNKRKTFTRFKRIRINPTSLEIDLNDTTFTDVEQLDDGEAGLLSYGKAYCCASINDDCGSANVNLKGTPFRLAIIDITCGGWGFSEGTKNISPDKQEVYFTGGGYCGECSFKTMQLEFMQ